MTVKVRSNSLQPGRPDSNQEVHLLLRSGRERVQLKRWWNSGGKHKNYIDCSAAEVADTNGCTYLLVWPHNYDTRLDITWAAHSGTITFRMFRRATHVALMCMDGTVIMHWVFGKAPGVKPRPYHINDSCPDGCTPGGDGGGGGGCNTDDDCPPGFICQGGICVPDPTPPPDTDHCWTIPELPTIDTAEPKAPLSTSLFTICTDIPGLPPLN
jgi:hypothetical protein